MSLIDKLETVKDKESFLNFTSELAKERSSRNPFSSGAEVNLRAFDNYVRTVLAWADALDAIAEAHANPASHWRKAATSIYCRK